MVRLKPCMPKTVRFSASPGLPQPKRQFRLLSIPRLPSRKPKCRTAVRWIGFREIFLVRPSENIGLLRKSPGRLRQTPEQASPLWGSGSVDVASRRIAFESSGASLAFFLKVARRHFYRNHASNECFRRWIVWRMLAKLRLNRTVTVVLTENVRNDKKTLCIAAFAPAKRQGDLAVDRQGMIPEQSGTKAERNGTKSEQSGTNPERNGMQPSIQTTGIRTLQRVSRIKLSL